VYYQNIA